MIHKIKKNITYLVFGKFTVLLISFFVIVISTRYLGVSNFGVFVSSLAVANIISKIVDLGFSQIIFREVSKDESNIKLINTAVTLRLMLLCFLIFFYNIFSFILESSITEVILTNILLLNIIFSARFVNIRDLLEIPFKSKLENDVTAKLAAGDMLVTLVAIIFVYIFDLGILLFVIFYTISNLPGFLLIIRFMNRRYNYRFRFTLGNYKYLVRTSLALYGYILFLAIYLQLDIVLVKFLSSNYSAGIYSAATRLTMPLGIVPLAVVSTIFPFLVRNIQNNISSAVIVSITNKVLLITAFIPSIIITFKSSEIVNLIFGPDYNDAKLPTILLFWSYLFMFYNFFAVERNTAEGKQIYNFFFAAIIAACMIFLTFIFIDYHDYNAVAFAKLVSAAIGTLFFILFKKLKIFNLSQFTITLIILSIILYYLSFLNLLFFIIFTLLIFILTIYFIKIFTRDEVDLILKVTGNMKYIQKILN